jgi:hypothetical protein
MEHRTIRDMTLGSTVATGVVIGLVVLMMVVWFLPGFFMDREHARRRAKEKDGRRDS